MSRYRLPDPKCSHARRVGAVMVSSHDDLAAARRANEPIASVWVCTRDACVEDAKDWVYASTHRVPVVKRPSVVAS